MAINPLCEGILQLQGIDVIQLWTRDVTTHGAHEYARFYTQETNCHTVSPLSLPSKPVMLPEPGVSGLIAVALLLAALVRGRT